MISMKDTTRHIRTRLAPSPTGSLHLGTARTAIFNWLFTRKVNGSFVLRIEDTDRERSDAQYEHDILEQLQWLGIDWDESVDVGGSHGPYRQSERTNRYEYYIRLLLEKNIAYHCFCSKEELEADRKAALEKGEAPRYSGKCALFLHDEARLRVIRKDASIIRFRVPSKTITFCDMIRGEISFDAGLIGDIAIAKDEKTPLYNFAVVVDDLDMNISHVIRGEDHISNTPKQILIQEAVGAPMPIYAHIPLILAPDKSKMSKRKGGFTVADFREQGYLPEALFNFLALLGWHPEDDQEIFTKEELTEKFSLERVQKSGATFNQEKLDWINGQYIRMLDAKTLYSHLKQGLKSKGWDAAEEHFVKKVITIEQKRMKTLNDFFELADFFFVLPEYPANMLNWKQNANEKTAKSLNLAMNALSGFTNNQFAAAELEKTLAPITEKEGSGDVLWPLRVALSGKKTSPGPYEIMEVLEKEESLKRIRAALKKL